jgi:hypothetical protein
MQLTGHTGQSQKNLKSVNLTSRAPTRTKLKAATTQDTRELTNTFT